jgi:hypothetical protein
LPQGAFQIVIARRVYMGSPTRLARWGEEEPQHEVKAYLPDMPTEYSERRRPDVAISTLT